MKKITRQKFRNTKRIPQKFYDDKKRDFFHMGHTLKKLIKKQNYYSKKMIKK